MGEILTRPIFFNPMHVVGISAVAGFWFVGISSMSGFWLVVISAVSGFWLVFISASPGFRLIGRDFGIVGISAVGIMT